MPEQKTLGRRLFLCPTMSNMHYLLYDQWITQCLCFLEAAMQTLAASEFFYSKLAQSAHAGGDDPGTKLRSFDPIPH